MSALKASLVPGDLPGERPSDPPKKSNLGTERGQGPLSGGSHWRERLFGAGAGVGVGAGVRSFIHFIYFISFI